MNSVMVNRARKEWARLVEESEGWCNETFDHDGMTLYCRLKKGHRAKRHACPASDPEYKRRKF